MKSPLHWKSALLFVASVLPLASGGSADIALARGCQSRSEPTLALASVRQELPVENRRLLSLAVDVPAESPRGNGAKVTPVSVQRTVDLHNPTLSMFLVTFAPGGSVALHGAPSRGYVLYTCCRVRSRRGRGKRKWVFIAAARPGPSPLLHTT